jgi:hypothetical protein
LGKDRKRRGRAAPALSPALEVDRGGVELYYGFRGGDRPKNAEKEFLEVCVMPKGAYEPWMLFRKPLGKKTVAENLRKWKTGGLRRLSLKGVIKGSVNKNSYRALQIITLAFCPDGRYKRIG